MGARSLGAWFAAGITALALACGDHNLGSFDGGGVDAAFEATNVDACLFGCDGAVMAPFNVTPGKEQDISVACNQTGPTVGLSATALDGTPITVAWSTDQVGVGTVTPTSGTSTIFTPTGAIGGMVDVIATYMGQMVTTPVFVKLTCAQNGNCPPSQIATNPNQLMTGGGIGGVGGEGCGGAVDPSMLGPLTSPSNTGGAQGLALTYPYPSTLWPRDLLAPNLMWNWSIGDADAIQISLNTTSGSFQWTGTFARPAILQQTGTSFIRHPIPQDIWTMATNTAGTLIHNQLDQLTMSLTIAKSGQGYGPITETWDVARGGLKGTVYYGSYGTRLSTSNWSNVIGASVLSISHNEASPNLVTSSTQCQVCHSVAAKGSDLVAEADMYPGDGNDWAVWYDLTTSTMPQWPGKSLPKTTPGLFTWGAASPDGSLYFTNSSPCYILGGSKCMVSDPTGLEGASDTPSGLYSLSSGNSVLTPTQIASQLSLSSQLGGALPEFSPDGTHVVFTFFKGGPGVDSKSGDGKSIAVVDFDQSTKTFSNLRTLYTPTCTGCLAVHPFFTPTNDSVVFEVITHANGTFSGTTADQGVDTSFSNCTNITGARAELWWVDLATQTPHRLDAANGVGYLPTGGQNHNDDTTLQYDPTVAPIVSGGYIWVAFTSRRLYGSIATLNPWCSQTNGVDFTPYSTNPMTKKLWVAGFDLSPTPNSDPSHPAFYLPGQELTAGNFRSFWVLDPCEQNGSSCQTGDQCCGGYCESSNDGGLVCGSMPQGCGGEGDSCTTSSDCCSSYQCVGGHCDVIPIK